MTITLNDLKNNLTTIESYARKVDVQKNELIPDYAGNKLFFPESIWGRFWKTVYLTQSLFGYPEEDFKLFNAIDKTYWAFMVFSQEAMDRYEDYKNFFFAQANDQDVDENKVKKARCYLVEWLEATNPFINLVEKNSKVAEQIQNVFYSLQFFRVEKEKKLDRCAYLIQLESLLSGDIPVKNLLKLSLERNIEANQSASVEEKIEMWIEKVNALGGAVDVRLFYRALSALIKYVGNIGDLGTLISALKRRGCKVLDEVDMRHITKYHHIESAGQVVGKTLEKVISSKNNRFFICTIKDEPDLIFITGSSQPDLTILSGDWWGISPAKVIKLDSEYRWALIENLKDPIANHKWTSEGEVLAKEDRELSMKVCNHIDKHINDDTHPEGLDLKHLMLNTKGELTTTTRYSKSNGFNFVEWEKLCAGLADSNPWVFHYLMKVSQLDIHPIAQYFRTIVMETLKDQKSTCLKITEVPKGIRETEVSDFAAKLSSEALSLFNICQGRLLEIKSDLKQDMDSLKEKISKRLIFYYLNTGAASVLHKNLIDNVIKTFDSKELSLDSLNSKYYKDELTEMQRREKSSKSNIL